MQKTQYHEQIRATPFEKLLRHDGPVHSTLLFQETVDALPQHQNLGFQLHTSEVVSEVLAIWILLGNFTGMRATFILFVFPEEGRRLLGTGKLAEGALTGTYSNRPFSTTTEIRTLDQRVVSSPDSLTTPTLYNCFFVSFTAGRRSMALSKQAHKLATPSADYVVPM